MSAARELQRAMERADLSEICTVGGQPWQLCASFEALDPIDDTVEPFGRARGELPGFLESYELGAGGPL